jgi:hypothetical protein
MKTSKSNPKPENDDQTLERIRKRAYELWEAGGGRHGDDRDHWLQAEQEIRAKETRGRKG